VEGNENKLHLEVAVQQEKRHGEGHVDKIKETHQRKGVILIEKSGMIGIRTFRADQKKRASQERGEL